jgi:hypothetical protein
MDRRTPIFFIGYNRCEPVDYRGDGRSGLEVTGFRIP